MGWFAGVCVQSSITAIALAGCLGTTTLLSASSAPVNVTSPGYPNYYDGTSPCMWSVSRGQNDVTRITVTEFHTDSQDTCLDTLDVIRVFPGGIRKSIGTWCERTYGQTVEVDSDVIIDFRPAVDSRSRLHVQIKHIGSKHLCNDGHMTQLTATETPMYLYSPLYPHISEGRNFSCRWTISPATSGHTIYLEAVHLELSVSEFWDSIDNSLNVVSGSLIKTMNGNKRFAMAGTASTMTVTLAVDTTPSYLGFHIIQGMMLRYYTSSVGLPKQPTPGSIIEMTAHPQPQFIEMRGSEFSIGTYTWKLTANSADKVVVMETIYWDLHNCNPTIKVYDGNTTSVPPVYEHCDSLPPQLFRSSGHVMILTSRVERTVSSSKGGFTIKYYAKDIYDFDMGTVFAEEKPAFVYLHVQHDQRPHQGQGFKVTSERSDRCVKLELVSASFQPISGLHFAQVLKVFDGRSSSADELGTCTNVHTPTITSSSTNMYIGVRQGAVSTVDGLWIKFYAVDDCSNNDIPLPAPSSPTNLPHKSDIFPDIKPVTCRWRIQPGNGRVKLNTVTLDLGYHGNNEHCPDGHIRAYDGHGGQRREITTWCTSFEPPVVSRGNMSMTVIYRSSAAGQDKYTITYRMIKDEDLEGSGGRIPYATSSVSYLRSPNHPGVYPNTPSTIWRLSAQRYYGRIELVVMEMDTEGNYGNCDGFDVLRIYDGIDKSDTSLKASLCGRHMDGHRVLSSGKDLLIEFHCNRAIARRGFIIAYTALKETVTSVCDKELLVDETMAVAKVPASSVQSKHSCIFTLRATPFYSIINLEFIFTGQNITNCTSEYLRVRNGRTLQSPVLGLRSCESRIKVESLGPEIHIEILPNPMIEIGLRHYSFLENQNCLPGWVKDLTSNVDVQTFSVSHISVKFTSMSECKWRLRSVTESHIISVNLTSENGVCEQVQIFDGFDDQSELLASWDGHKPALHHSSGMYIYITSKITNCMDMFYVDFNSVAKPITTPIPELSSTSSNSHETGLTTSKPEPVTTSRKPEPVTTSRKPEPVTTSRKPEPVTTSRKPEPVTTSRKPVPVTTPRKPEPLPSQTTCTCPPCSCGQNGLECNSPTGDNHAHSALILGGCMAGFSLLSLVFISTLLLLRFNKVKEHYMVSHRAARRHPRPPAANTAFDEPYPEVFDPNDPRLDEEGDLGLGSRRQLSGRFSRSHSNPSYELSLEKDLEFNTAL